MVAKCSHDANTEKELCRFWIGMILVSLLSQMISPALAASRNPRGIDGFQTISIRKGGDALLGCDVPQSGSKEPHVIEWFRQGTSLPVFIKAGKHPPHINQYFEGRMFIADDSSTNASLLITNVTESDDGWYECRILFFKERFEKSSNGTFVKLEVTDPPKFLRTPPESKIATQGQSLLLRCVATGRPRPYITWRKDGVLLKDGQNGIRLSSGELAVTSLTKSHRGKYTCRAQSVEGQIEFGTRVYVEAPPEFRLKPASVTAEEGNEAVFSCSAVGYPSDIKYSWTYNGELVEKSSAVGQRSAVFSDGTLVIYHVSSKDKGTVTCNVTNGVGEPKSASADLFVQFKARVAMMPAIIHAGLGLRSVLHCPAEAQPPVNKVVWKKNGVVLSPQHDPRISMDANGSLILASARPRDAGQYSCTPHNIVGTLGPSTRTTLVISDPPFFTLIPRPTYEGEIGKSLSIPCRGEGEPPPNVSWRKHKGDGVEYRDEFGNLTIPYITEEAHGVWQCVLTNSVAEVAKDVMILVKYTSPHRVTNVSAQAFGSTAIRISWTPGYSGGHPQHFMLWYKQVNRGDHSWKTSHVEDGHTVAVVDGLLPDTAYELAVLPENKIKSGPFSETVIVKTLAAKAPVEAPALLSPPQALFASKTKDGYMQLSWRNPRINQAHRTRTPSERDAPSPVSSTLKLLGFLVEYRWTDVDPASPSDDNSRRPSARSKRAYLRHHHPDSGRMVSRSKRSAGSDLPQRDKWEQLTTTYNNVTTIVVMPGKIYRDLKYDFRVLTVSENEYSAPSNPVSVSTKGWVAYPCYTGILQPPAAAGHPILIGVLTAVCLVVLLVIIALIYMCRKRKMKAKKSENLGETTASTSAHGNHANGDKRKQKMNGDLASRNYPTVVDLTESGPEVYGTMEKREFETGLSDEEAKTALVKEEDRKAEREKNEALLAFLEKHNADWDGGYPDKERGQSDRSSVRIRRETAARILSEQFKRRSLTDHLRNSVKKDIPLRGGVRSASTSPERSKNITFDRPDRLNVTAPAAVSAPQPRRKIRLYSRPIDDPSCTQQRHMIIIKRKSQKSSSSETGRTVSNRAPPSDSSESPVFGVVGTINHPNGAGKRGRSSATNSPTKSSAPNASRQSRQSDRHGSSFKGVFSPTPSSPVDDEVFNGSDARNKHDDVIASRDVTSDDSSSPWVSPMSQPLSTSSPKESSSPDVSPNRVVARHTVAYDPANERNAVTKQPHYDLYSTDPHWGYQEKQKTNSLTRNRTNAAQRGPRMDNSGAYVYPQYAVSPPGVYRGVYEPMSDPHGQRPPPTTSAYQRYNHDYRRMSLSQHPVAPHGTQYPGPQHHGAFARNASRTRASFTYGHQPLALSPSRDVYPVSPYGRPVRGPSGAAVENAHQDQSQQSALEIDCSNSDIEVRFVKDPNGQGYIQAPVLGSRQFEGRGEIVNRGQFVSPVSHLSRFPESGIPRTSHGVSGPRHPFTTPPSSGYIARDARSEHISPTQPQSHRQRSRSSSPVKSSTPRERTQSVAAGEFSTAPKAVRPRHLLSPSRITTSSPLRNAKPSVGPGSVASRPLGAVGSSDYGSQDTSNSSASPTTQAKSTTSPLHNRVLGIPGERSQTIIFPHVTNPVGSSKPPRRDNSSVEDNYEWDSEIAMESEILEALRHFGALKKTGPVSDELLDELNKFTKDTKNLVQRPRAHSADVLGANSPQEWQKGEIPAGETPQTDPVPELSYSKESMARRCAALRAEFLHYQQLQQLDEDEIT